MSAAAPTARDVLLTAEAAEKARIARAAVAGFETAGMDSFAAGPVPDRPARPEQPELRPPGEMQRRRLGTVAGRAALIHAIAHIELNAIDLAFDMICRFAGDVPADLREAFIRDWLGVGDDEARHFTMLAARLAELGFVYGDLPAHDGLWEAAVSTSDNVLARLSVAPLVLEARGLDVTPPMIEKLKSAGDETTAAILSVIYEEEIGHVRIGAHWLKKLCEIKEMDAEQTFQHFVRERFEGKLKPPFNHEARNAAGLEENFYHVLSG